MRMMEQQPPRVDGRANIAAPFAAGRRPRLDLAMTQRIVTERTIAGLLRLIDRKGGDLAPVLKHKAGSAALEVFLRDKLPALDDAGLRQISSVATIELANIQTRAAGGSPFRGCDWHMMLFCLVNSGNLRDAIHNASALFEVADGRMGTMELIEYGDTAQVVMTGSRSDDNELALVVALNALVVYHEMFSWLIARPLGGTAHLDLPEHCRTMVNEDLLPFDLILDASRPGFSFYAGHLDQPVVRAIAKGERHMVSSLFHYTERSEPEEIAGRAKRFVSFTLQDSGRLPSLDQLSDALGVARMTLRRRLAAAGTSFQEIKDSERRSLATNLLDHTRLSIEQIAERLDFCDSDAFRTAFRAWEGMPPTEYRRRLREVGQAG